MHTCCVRSISQSSSKEHFKTSMKLVRTRSARKENINIHFWPMWSFLPHCEKLQFASDLWRGRLECSEKDDDFRSWTEQTSGDEPNKEYVPHIHSLFGSYCKINTSIRPLRKITSWCIFCTIKYKTTFKFYLSVGFPRQSHARFEHFCNFPPSFVVLRLPHRLWIFVKIHCLFSAFPLKFWHF